MTPAAPSWVGAGDAGYAELGGGSDAGYAELGGAGDAGYAELS